MSEISEKGNNLESLRYVGQKAEIRRVDPTNEEELSRLRKLDQDPNRIQWFESKPESYEPLTTEQLIEFAKHGDDHMLFAISGSELVSGLEESEVGELQGWVKINADTEDHVRQMAEQGIVPQDQAVDLVWEVSYAKLEDAPKGQMASGLRQVCVELAKMNAVMSESTEKPELVLCAYVIPGNEPSIKVLEASGFEERGRIQYDEEAEEPDQLFVLNWAKLNDILHASAEQELGH